MTQLAETKTIVESTVANLLSSLRTANMASGSSSSNNGFASLLDQVGASVAQIDQNDKKAAYSQPDDARKSKEILERDVPEAQERPVEEQKAAPQPVERKEVKQEEAPAKETSCEDVQSEPVERKEASDSDDGQETTVVAEDGAAAVKDEESDDLEEDLEALIAALAPFIGPAPETVVAVKGESVTEAGQAGNLGGVEATEEGLLASLQRLENLQGEIEAAATDGGEDGAQAKELNQILKQIAGEIASLKDTMTQEADTQVLTERLAGAAQEKAAPTEASQDMLLQASLVDDAVTLEQPRSPRAQFVQNVHQSLQAAEQAAVETQTASAVAVAQSAMTGQGAAEWKTSTGTLSQASNATQTHLIGLSGVVAGVHDVEGIPECKLEREFEGRGIRARIDQSGGGATIVVVPAWSGDDLDQDKRLGTVGEVGAVVVDRGRADLEPIGPGNSRVHQHPSLDREEDVLAGKIKGRDLEGTVIITAKLNGSPDKGRGREKVLHHGRHRNRCTSSVREGANWLGGRIRRGDRWHARRRRLLVTWLSRPRREPLLATGRGKDKRQRHRDAQRAPHGECH